MTEPTWKDPLLREWWEGCAADEQERLGKALDMFLDAQSTPAGTLDHLAGLAICNFAVDRLRSLIDAELARGREAVEVLRLREWDGGDAGGECLECGNRAPDHQFDCRLAKLIGEKV